MSSLSQPIDIYCERMGPELWAEPLNAVTNGAFLLAAFLLYRQANAYGATSASIYWLIGLVGLIGLGSAAFHTFANRLTLWMDVLPITIFLLSYIVVFARSIGGQSFLSAALWVALFLGLSIAFGYAPQSISFNGSIAYAPALIYLLGMSFIVRRKQYLRISHSMALAAILFMVSMTMRSIDMMVCDMLSIGTHYMWHILNAVVLYLVVSALIHFQKEGGGPRA